MKETEMKETEMEVEPLKKVLIVGAGALGSHLALFLRNEEALFTVADFDRVEMKNTRSQFHARQGVGKPKASALQMQLVMLFQSIQFRGLPRKVEETNVSWFVESHDFVVDCTDNAKVRLLLQEECRKQGKDIVHGALSANGDFGRVVWGELFVVDSEDVEGQPTCEDGEFLPFIGLVSSMLALSVQDFLKTGSKRSYQISPQGVFKL